MGLVLPHMWGPHTSPRWKGGGQAKVRRTSGEGQANVSPPPLSPVRVSLDEARPQCAEALARPDEA